MTDFAEKLWQHAKGSVGKNLSQIIAKKEISKYIVLAVSMFQYYVMYK